MAEKIPVAIVEDNKVYAENLARNLADIGCVVVVIASTMIEVMNDLIPRLEEISFVFLDNTIEEFGDGREIAALIRQQPAPVILIGFSSGSQDYVDRQLGKTYWGFTPLRESVKSV